MGAIDADLARMLADLGGSRRDDISAPCADNKGNIIRIDAREEAAALARDNQRREQIRNQAQTNENCARLDAWNVESNFESVGPQESLANFTNGQSHRASLRLALGHRDEKRETRERQYDSERSLYLQQRGNGSITSQPITSSVSRSRGEKRVASLGRKSREEPSSSLKARQSRSRPGRAPSPRAAGTVRFVRGQRIDKDTVPLPSSTQLTAKISPQAKMDLLTGEPMLIPTFLSTTPTYGNGSASAKTKDQAEPTKRNLTPTLEKSRYPSPNKSVAAKERIARAQMVDEAIRNSDRRPDSPEFVSYYQTHPERKAMLVEVNHLRRLLRKSIRDFRIFVEDHPVIEDIAEAVEQAAMEDSEIAKPSPASARKPATAAPIHKARPVNGTTPAINGKQNTGVLTLRVLNTEAQVMISRPMVIKPPIKLNIDVIGQSGNYDPMRAAVQIERMMQQLSLNDDYIEGAKLQADGLWVAV